MLRGFLTSVALLAALPLTASADNPRTLETVKAGPFKAEHAQAATVLYFNRCIGGCNVMKANDDDVRTRSSTIPGGPLGGQHTLSAFMHGDTVWNDMMTCLKEVYSPYNVTVTDVQPMPGVPYNENIVAGAPAEIMYSNAAGGVSPVTGDCSPFSYVISYTFANTYGPKPFELCYVGAQETGHSFGMADHSFSFISDNRSACSDPMSYRQDCLRDGQRFFRNEAATCGEFSERPCNCSGMNSHLKLLTALGPGQSLIAPPTVAITAPTGGTIGAGAGVSVTAASKRGVAKLELWLNGYKWAETKGMAFTQTGQPTGPYQLTIPAEVPNSIIDIVVKAKDDIGAERSSDTVTVTKGAACADASTCAAGQKCEAGKCFWDPAAGAVGEVCTYPQFCTSGICLAVSGDDDMRCTQTCVPNVGDSCPPDFECVTASATSGVCWPKSDDAGGCCSTGREGVAQTALLGFGLVFLLRRRRSTKR